MKNFTKQQNDHYHSSSERIWFPRPPDPFELPEATTTTASEDTTLEDEEVEVKLPCRSVSINVVGMPSNHEVTSSRPVFEVPPLPPLPKKIEATPSKGQIINDVKSFGVSTKNLFRCHP